MSGKQGAFCGPAFYLCHVPAFPVTVGLTVGLVAERELVASSVWEGRRGREQAGKVEPCPQSRAHGRGVPVTATE